MSVVRAFSMAAEAAVAAEAAMVASRPRVVLQPLVATMADYDEMLYWALNTFTYCEPVERLMGITAKDARPYYEWCLPRCLASGLSLKLIDEDGQFAGYRHTEKALRDDPQHYGQEITPLWKAFDNLLTEIDHKAWELHPDAQKLVHHHGGFIVPHYQGRTDFSKVHISALIDYNKLKTEGFYGEYSAFTNPRGVGQALKAGLKVLHKPDMRKHRMPDGSPIPLPKGLEAPLLIFRKF